jgi:hypothetical protein
MISQSPSCPFRKIFFCQARVWASTDGPDWRKTGRNPAQPLTAAASRKTARIRNGSTGSL